MEAILSELNDIELVNEDKLKNYEILPQDIKNNCSTEIIARTIKNLKLLFENVKILANPKCTIYPVIQSTDDIYVCTILIL